MKKKTDKNPCGAGRGRVMIDWNKIKMMAQAGCTIIEASEAIGINRETLHRRFMKDRNVQDFEGRYTCLSEYFQDQRAGGNALIKVKQFEKAVKGGNERLLVWLGKNRLGQSDKKQVESTVNSVNTTKVDISKIDDKDLELIARIIEQNTVDDQSEGDSSGDGEA